MSHATDKMIENLRFYVKERQLGIAEKLAEDFTRDTPPFNHSGFVILSIVAAYFEMIRQFDKGESSYVERENGKGYDSKSRKFFIEGFKLVYDKTELSDKEIGQIYSVVRCGMYHGGMPKVGCHLSRNFRSGIHLCKGEVHINPAEMVREVKEHFDRYIASLVPESDLLTNFEKMCEIVGLDTEPQHETWCDKLSNVTTTSSNPADKGKEPQKHRTETEQ
ncbi:hypothetical protein GC176_21760 [bacterium]|nr:hypothetical protein [bacterium]